MAGQWRCSEAAAGVVRAAALSGGAAVVVQWRGGCSCTAAGACREIAVKDGAVVCVGRETVGGGDGDVACVVPCCSCAVVGLAAEPRTAFVQPSLGGASWAGGAVVIAWSCGCCLQLSRQLVRELGREQVMGGGRRTFVFRLQFGGQDVQITGGCQS